MTAVITLEHTRMRPGEVATALLAWTQAVVPGTVDRIAPTCMCPECCGDAPRQRLEQALIALPQWAQSHPYAWSGNCGGSPALTSRDEPYALRVSDKHSAYVPDVGIRLFLHH